MKKLRTFFALLTAASIFTSCAGGETAETVGTDPVETDTTTVETEDIYTDLPTGDFGGEELVFANETESSNWAILLLDAETINGEVMNDAVYNRNRLVEDRLNIRIRCESFEKAAAALGADPAQTLVFEDSLMGVRAAKCAGMKCIALTTSYPEPELYRERADAVLPDPSVLANIFDIFGL